MTTAVIPVFLLYALPLRATPLEDQHRAEHPFAGEAKRQADNGSPPDTLGGVTVGTKLDRTGFICDENSSACVKPTTIAGERGTLAVFLCGEVVEGISFSIAYFYSPGIVPTPAMGKGYAPTRLYESSSATGKRLLRALQSEGWHLVKDEAKEEAFVHPGFPEGTKTTLTATLMHADGRWRTFTSTTWGVPNTYISAMDAIASPTSKPCTDGL